MNKAQNLRREVRWKIQRAQRGYSDADVWSFDHYLARIISEGVGQLKNTGHPTELTQDEWNEILTKIESGFAAYAARCFDGSWKEEERVMKESFKLLRKWFGGLWY